MANSVIKGFSSFFISLGKFLLLALLCGVLGFAIVWPLWFFAVKSPNLYSVSFRGKHRNVSIIAEAFGGGGHKLASGCNIFGTHNTIIEKIEKVIIDNYDRICEC